MQKVTLPSAAMKEGYAILQRSGYFTKATDMARIDAFVIRAQAGQVRKDGTTPACLHGIRVGYHLEDQFILPLEIIAAGKLHDVIEDGGESWRIPIVECLSSLKTKINQKMIMDMLDALTKDMSLPNRAARNADMIKRAIEGPEGTVIVKCYDRIDNLLESDVFTNEFFKLYAKETQEMIEGFAQAYEKGDLDPETDESFDLVSESDEAISELEQTLEEVTNMRRGDLKWA